MSSGFVAESFGCGKILVLLQMRVGNPWVFHIFLYLTIFRPPRPDHMKRIVTLLLLLPLCLPLLRAQSFEIYDLPAEPVALEKSLDEEKIYLNIINTSEDTLDLLIFRTANNMATGQNDQGQDTSHQTYFCWDLCYGVNGAQSISPIRLAAGDTTNTGNLTEEQYVAFLPNDIDGFSSVTLRIINADDPNDFREVTVQYSVGGAVNSISDAQLAARSLSAPYPNPAHDLVKVDFDLPRGTNGTLRLFNLVGKEVLRQSLHQPQGSATMDVSQLPRGMYFLYLHDDHRELSSRRVVLR